jgi:hypothetical protein
MTARTRRTARRREGEGEGEEIMPRRRGIRCLDGITSERVSKT